MSIGMLLGITAAVCGALVLFSVGTLAILVGVGLICAGLSKVVA